jgi:hypothetical protein
VLECFSVQKLVWRILPFGSMIEEGQNIRSLGLFSCDHYTGFAKKNMGILVGVVGRY